MRWQKAKMRYSKTLPHFGVGLGVRRSACLVGLSAYLGAVSLWFIPFGVLFRLSAFCSGGGGPECRLRCMVSNVTCNVLLLPSAAPLAQISLRCVSLYIRNNAI